MESTHGCDGHELHLAHSFLAPQASQVSHPTLVFNDEFKREVLIEREVLPLVAMLIGQDGM